MFRAKTLLIIRGTGTFFSTVVKRFQETKKKEYVFLQKMKKQDDMYNKYFHPNLHFYIGDMRNEKIVRDAIYGVAFVSHAVV